jgi:hypothetical protein
MKNKQFRNALVMAKYAANSEPSDGAGINYIAECFGLEYKKARKLWFDATQHPAQRVNSDTTLYKEIALHSNPFKVWSIDKRSRTVELFGRKTKLFNY